MPGHSDRCCNPFANPGEKRHYGTNLRRVSKNFLENNPGFPKNAKICHECRKTSQNIENESTIENGIYDNNVSRKRKV